MTTDITWDLLREAWFKDKVFSGPSEKFDSEQEWDQFVKGWETDRSDLQTLRRAYKNLGTRYEHEHAEVIRLRQTVHEDEEYMSWLESRSGIARERDLTAEVERWNGVASTYAANWSAAVARERDLRAAVEAIATDGQGNVYSRLRAALAQTDD